MSDSSFQITFSNNLLSGHTVNIDEIRDGELLRTECVDKTVRLSDPENLPKTIARAVEKAIAKHLGV